MRVRPLALASLLLGLAACERSAPRAPTCRVEESPQEGRVVVCVDGTRARLPGSGGCDVAPTEGGGVRVSCADGTGVELDAGPPAAGCRVEPGGGERWLRCADGTDVPLGAADDGRPCVVEELGPGTRVVRCPDGTTAMLYDGADGGACAVVDHGDGTRTVACEDGTNVTVEAGAPGGGCTLEEGAAGSRVLTCDDGSRVTILSGRAGSACEVAVSGDGTQSLRCADGTQVQIAGGRDAAACVVDARPDGTYVAVCPDGTRVVVVPADGRPGEITGTVRIVGGDDATGTLVRLAEPGREAACDRSGRFALAGVSAGVYELTVERDGFVPARVRNVIVNGGVTRLDEVTLRRAELAGAGLYLDHALVLPGGSRAVFSRFAEGSVQLVLRDAASGRERALGRWPASVAAVDDGRRLVSVEEFWSRRALVLHDLDAGTAIELDEDVDSRTPVLLDGGSAVAYHTGIEEYDLPYYVQGGCSERNRSGEFVVRELAAGQELFRAPRVCSEWSLALRDRLIVLDDCDGCGPLRGTLVTVDVRTGAATSHGGPVAGGDVRPSPDGRRIAALRGRAFAWGEVLVVDAASGAETVVGTAPPGWRGEWRPDSEMFAYDGAFAWDAQSGTTTALGVGRVRGFSPDSATLLLAVPGATSAITDLELRDIRTGATSMVIANASAGGWSPDSRRLYVVRHGGSPGDELVEHDLATGVQTLLGSPVPRAGGLVGPGGTVLFHEVPEPSSPLMRLVHWDPATATRTVVSERAELDDAPWRRATGDGSRFVFRERSPGAPEPPGGSVYAGPFDHWLWDVATSTATRICERCEVHRIEPDGRSIVFVEPSAGPTAPVTTSDSPPRVFGSLPPGRPIASLGLFDADLGTSVLVDDQVFTPVPGDGTFTYVRTEPAWSADGWGELYLLRLP